MKVPDWSHLNWPWLCCCLQLVSKRPCLKRPYEEEKETERKKSCDIVALCKSGYTSYGGIVFFTIFLLFHPTTVCFVFLEWVIRGKEMSEICDHVTCNDWRIWQMNYAHLIQKSYNILILLQYYLYKPTGEIFYRLSSIYVIRAK